MPTSIAALTPPGQTIPHRQHDDVTPGVPEMAFSELWQDKKEGLSFGDFLDIINPLQHIPVVSTIYRLITGDEIGVGSRLVGGAMFGGPIGLVGAGIVALFENVSGETVEHQVASLWEGVTGGAQPPQQMASVEGASRTGPEAQAVVGRAGAPATRDSDMATAKTDTATTPVLAAMAPPGAATAAVPLPPAWTPPSLPAKSAIQIDESRPRPVAHTDAAAERQRIAQSVQQAQRAQAALLLASVGANRESARAGETEDSGATSETSARDHRQPFQPHPYMLPPGAPPELINRAMARALDRYQTMLQQRNAAATPASPRPAPAPIR